MALRRGFKSEARGIADEVRTELGLLAFDPLDPIVLAKHLGIPVFPLSEFSSVAPASSHFLTKEQEAFSAVTVFHGHARAIVHNDAHAHVRQRSNLAHELAHALIGHRPSPAIDERGCRNWDDNIESEAKWLAGELLVTEDATLAVARGQFSFDQACTLLMVSRPMLKYRINVTGARKRVERARNFRKR